MSEMLGNPPFHREEEENEGKWGEENGEILGFMINCPATCSSAERQVIGSLSLWPPPHTSAYDSLESLWRWKGTLSKYSFLVLLYHHNFHLTLRFYFPIKKMPQKVSDQAQHLQATPPS